MAGPDPRQRETSAQESPRALSALLQELAHAPEAETGTTWTSALHPGAVIGRFELIREIGRGGFGVVWEARDRDLGRHVAFKAVRTKARRDVRDERVLLEADAAARLSHPNIVTLHDVGRSEHGPYLVLELLHGKTLAERLDLGPLPVREAVRIAVDITKGMAHAHAHGVVHRDLKPENVFLCDDGQVKVLDFGMAHAFGRRAPAGGTPVYMAPEQLEGAPEDERTDVFALGVILYEMLSGTLPFDGERALRSRSAPLLLDVPGEPALGEFLGRMLDKQPARRPRDGEEVLSALSSFATELHREPPMGTVRTRKRSSPVVWLVAAAAIALAVAGWWAEHHGDARTSRAQGAAAASVGVGLPPSIAVLPFTDLSPGEDEEYFADGIAEEILNALTQVEGLRVPGRISSFAFKGKNEDLRTIGERLNVSAVLEGSVRKEGQHVRITAEIVSVADGYRLWSKTFEREQMRIFAVQDEIAQAVLDALRVRRRPGTDPPSTRPLATSHPEAYTQYLIAEHLLALGSSDDQRRAITALDKAIAIDPAYAPAWARLATALRNLAGVTRTRDGNDLRRRAADAARKSVELGPDYGLAYTVRAWIRTLDEWDWAGAQADIEHALALSPGHFEVHNVYGILLGRLGRLPEAIAEEQKAVDLDPFHTAVWCNLGYYFMGFGDFAHAREAFERALGFSPENDWARYDLAILALLEDRPAEALTGFQRTADAALRLRGVAIAQHSLGHRGESDRALNELVARAGTHAPYDVALVHAWRGEADRAFEWFDIAYERHDPSLGNLKYDPLLRSLRADARFTALLRKMNLP